MDRVPLESATKCRRREAIYYLVKGRPPPGYVLASSAPLYVIDADGRVIEWVEDPGDQPSAMRKWEGAEDTEVDLVTVLRETAQAGGERAGQAP